MSRTRSKAPRRPLTERREPYLGVFLLGFAMLLLVIVPVMIVTKGYFIYYGDFNSQQLPFYHLAHDAVRNGNFGWNWQTDLGANFIGSYSFYLLGSPFFWLTVPFPQEWTLYLIPYLLALKHGIAALTSYAFIRRFVRSRQASLIGALLYAFSGFQIYNIFFNHFQDVTAFFPLLLIAMEQRINENRRGVFALTVAFMAILNYYFFTGQVFFAVLYFILRCPAEDFHADLRKFFSIALESVIGVLLASFMLVPSALAILGNDRIRTMLWGIDMVAYSDRTRLWRILQGFFMMPDVPARPNLFQSDYGKWASIAGYLPMYSMAGVIAFMSQKRKHWATRLVAVCTVCAFVPVLNSAFYMLNGSYYARWFYMPILIMAMMTAYALDNPKIRWRGGLTVCGIVIAFFTVISLLPKKEEDQIVWFSIAKYPWYVWLSAALCAIMLYFAVLICQYRRKSRFFFRSAIGMTVFSCICTAAAMVYFGLGLSAFPTTYVNTAIKGGGEISLEMPAHQFARVDISQDCDNYPMFWGYSNMRCFHSIVPPSLMHFYESLNISRDVASRAEPKHYALRALFSVKYYFDRDTESEDDGAEYSYTLDDLPGFTYQKKENGFYIYENEAYVPMGIAYDAYIREDAFKEIGAMTAEKVLLKALVLNGEQAEQYGDILTELSAPAIGGMTGEEYLEHCKELAKHTCSSFEYDSYGFRAAITLNKPELVFFSVPSESGWTAEVNGQSVPVETVSNGFMAVRCKKGDNQIVFRYQTPGLKQGAAASLCGIAALLIYLIWLTVAEHGSRPKMPKQKHSYDYAGVDMMFEHAVYTAHAAAKHSYAAASGRRRRKPEADHHDGSSDS